MAQKKHTITLVVHNLYIRIYINGLLHLAIKEENLVAIQSYVSGTDARYCIDYILKDSYITSNYDTREKWQAVLKLLDENL